MIHQRHKLLHAADTFRGDSEFLTYHFTLELQSLIYKRESTNSLPINYPTPRKKYQNKFKMKSPILTTGLCLLLTSASHGFQPSLTSRQSTQLSMTQKLTPEENPSGESSQKVGRRSFLTSAVLLPASTLLQPQPASAGIDVSGLRSDVNSNSVLAEQLKAYDGSASARVRDLKEIAPITKPSASPVAIGAGAANVIEEQGPTATWLYRASPGFNPRLSRAGILGTNYRYDDQVVAPASSKANSLSLTFEFPSDWLQLEKFLGGISYVDQRNGDRLWLLRSKLPEGERLATIPKAFFGPALFDPKGTIVKSGGIDIDDYKVSSAVTLSDCPTNTCATHKRFKIKYATITGNGLRVERRALVDAYEVSPEGDVYMLMTSSNAVKFDAKDSPQRATVESIVDSFSIDI